MPDEQGTQTEPQTEAQPDVDPLGAGFSVNEDEEADVTLVGIDPPVGEDAKPGAEGEATPDEPDEPEPVALDWRLKQAASRAGLEEADIEALGDRAEAVLGKMADSLDAVSEKFAKMGQADEPGDVTEEPPEKPVEKPVDEPRPKPKASSKDDIALGLDDSDFDEESLDAYVKPVREAFAALKGQNEALKGEYAALEARMAPMLEHFEATQAKESMDALDTFCEEVAEHFGDVYGKGKTFTLDEGSKEFTARQSLYGLAGGIFRSSKRVGVACSQKEALAQALSLRHREKSTKVTKAKADREAARTKRAGQVTPKTTRRGRAAVPKSLEGAVAKVRQHMAERGISEE